MSWFSDCKTIEALKRKYHVLARKYHPDLGGDSEAMKSINNEFDRLAKILKNRHEKVSSESAENSGSDSYEKEIEFDSGKFRDIISVIIHFENVKIEIIGSWIWITGNTYPYREKLKELSFKWSKSKSAWYYAEYLVPHVRGKHTLNNIRNMFGTTVIDTVEQIKIGG